MSAVARAPVQSLIPLLVVSLDNGDYSSLQRILKLDCLFHRATGRQEALSLVRSHRPRAVICDQILADGDWRDLLADLQEEQEAPPLIVSSYLADDKLWAEVLNLGGYDLVMKPFIGMEVSRAVRLAALQGAVEPASSS